MIGSYICHRATQANEIDTKFHRIEFAIAHSRRTFWNLISLYLQALYDVIPVYMTNVGE